jgi:diacylglycerol kinase family enzyme
LTEGGDLVGRTRIDSGKLGVVAVAVYDPPSVRGLVEAIRAFHLGRFAGLKQWACSSFRIESDDEKVLAGVDGEALQLKPPLEFAIVPQGLRVLVPAGTRSPAPKRRTVDPATLRRLWDVATKGEDPASDAHTSSAESG